ncbi:hypothetical protein [Actinomadura rupiterrae]|uniref:hypothetical protein n=1 Tax=Actinomadura rupiterrae TaxID=559627 RepID=UPI0020A34CA4|nr:hypothetical protein [Actinomadura rupiterrae]MCP2340400.1 hypothetical protein [Actinomadura rupiterrae]
MDDFIRPYQLFDRLRLIMGLRALATFLEENPAVPAPSFMQATVFADRDDCERARRAEVNRIAVLLGVTPDDDTANGGHYTATKSFGRVEYHMVHITDATKRAHQALMSYANNFDRLGTASADSSETGRAA